MLRDIEKDFNAYYSIERPHSDTNYASDTGLFVSTLKDLHQRTKKILKLCEPFSLVYKELEDVLLIIETKENYFTKVHERGDDVGTCGQNISLKSFLKNQHYSKDGSVNTLLDDSITEDDSVQKFRRQGRELINEYKSVLDEMKNKNQALKAICFTPSIQQLPASVTGFKRDLLSPTNVSFPNIKTSISPSLQVTSPSNQTTIAKFNTKAALLTEPQVNPKQGPSYNEVLLNIEKFMRSLDQRAQGQNKRIENITQELGVLRQQMQPYKHITEINDIAKKLEEQHELLQEKSIRECTEEPQTALDQHNSNEEVAFPRLPNKNINSTNIAEQIQQKVSQMNEIHSNFDECSKLLVRKRLEHTYAKENGNLSKNDSEPELSLTPRYQNLKENQSQERLLDSDRNLNRKPNFDVEAALSRRELRMKNYLEREERMKTNTDVDVNRQRAIDSRRSSIFEDVDMFQTLKRSGNQNRFNEAEAVEVRINYGSKLNTAAKVDEEMISTKKSCLSRRGMNSKENSLSKGEKHIRFADEVIEGRALRFDELEVIKPLDIKDVNVQPTSKRRVQRSALKGEITQLDEEIKTISQLLNSAMLSEQTSTETK